MDIQIQVTPWGKIQIQLYNQATQQEVAKHVIGSDVIDNKEITQSNHEIMVDLSVSLYSIINSIVL